MMHTSGANTVASQRSWATKAVCLALSLLLVSVYGLTRLSPDASAAAPLDAPELQSPLNGAVVDTNPVFSWGAVSGATYYKFTYTDGTGAHTYNVYATKFAPPMQLTNTTGITWSVLANNGVDGALATRTLDKQPSDSTKPDLLTPSDGAELVFPGTPPTFSWDPIDGVRNYVLSISTSSGFVPASTTTYNTQSTSFTLTKAQPYDQTYYWKVQGQYTTAQTNAVATAESEVRTYSVMWGDMNLAKPTLKSPSNSATNSITDVELKWDPLLGASTYEVQVSPNGDWQNNLLYDVITDSTVWSPAQTLDNTGYYWRVRAADHQGNNSQWSDQWQFRRVPLAAPTLIGPLGGNVTNFQLQWLPVPGAGAYQVQVYTDSNFSFISQQDQINHTCLTTHTDWSPYTYVTPPGQFSGPGNNGTCLLNSLDQRYLTVGSPTLFWRVRAIDDYNQSDLTAPWNVASFTKANQPQRSAVNGLWSSPASFAYRATAPNFRVPASGSVTVPKLSWAAIPGTQYYVVKIYKNGNPYWTSNTTSTSYVPSLQQRSEMLPTAGKSPVDFSWTVQAVDYNMRGGPTSTALPFTWSGFAAGTVAPGDPIPLLAPSPTDNSTVVGNPSFAWSPVVGADHYEVLWFKDMQNAPDTYFPLQDTNRGGNQANPVAEAFTPVEPLDATPGGGAYQVLALDSNNAVIGASAKRNVTIAQPTDVATTSPGAQCTPIGCTPTTVNSTPLLSWARNDQAAFYRVYIAGDEGFTNPIRTYDTQQTSMRSVEALPDSTAGSSYFWYVQACYKSWKNPYSIVCGRTPQDANTNAPGLIRSFKKQSTAITGLKVLDPGSDTSSTPDSVCGAPDKTTVADVPTFCWNQYSSGGVGAMTYHIQVSASPNMSPLIDDAYVDQTSYTPYAAHYNTYGPNSYVTPATDSTPASIHLQHLTYPDGPLYWRVQAVDSTNNQLTASPVVSFQKESPGVALTAPTSGQSIPSTPMLSWTPKTFASEYNVEVYKNGDTTGSSANRVFAELTDYSAITPTNGNIINGQSLPQGTYAWRVRGVAAHAGTDLNSANKAANAWSEWRTFTIAPAKPGLTAPTSNQQFTSNSVFYEWTKVPGAVSYRIYVSTSSNPQANPNLENIKTVMTSYGAARSYPNGDVYFQVDALDAQDQLLSRSDPRKFHMDTTRPQVTNLVATPTGSKSIKLTWQTSVNSALGGPTKSVVTAYLNNAVIGTQTVVGTGSQLTYSGLTPNTNYQFTVTAYDSAGAGPESNRVNAKTLPGNSPNQSYVIATYTDFLNRAPTSSELSYNTQRLNTGTSRGAYVNDLANSPAWVNAIVTGFYVNTLGRGPDSGGLNYWSQRIRTGQVSVAGAAASFYSSKEYFAVTGHSNLTTWVRDLYPKLLGRVPDSGGVAYWVAQAQKGSTPTAGRTKVAYGFYQSFESRMKRVNDLYLALLHRSPDVAGQKYWAGLILTSGDIALAKNLATSSEYYNSAQVRYP